MTQLVTKTRLRPALPADAPAILAVQAAGWDATYRGLLPDRVFPTAGDAGGIRWWREALTGGELLTRVAVTSSGKVVGFAAGGARRDPNLPADGEIHGLYVDPDHHRQGVGRRLFTALAHALAARGHRGLGLWVLTANGGAQAFYARLGGAPRVRQVSRERGVDFDETGYVWVPIERAFG